jgi:hypothetical protein
MSSIVTKPADAAKFIQHDASRDCCFCKLWKSCSRFIVSGTNDGNSITSDRSIFGSSSNARVFKMPTIVSGVSS